MSVQPTNLDLYNVLLGIKADVGAITAKVDVTQSQFRQHVEDDKILALNIKHLEVAFARQSGAVKVWAIVLGAIISVIGAVAAHFVDRH